MKDIIKRSKFMLAAYTALGLSLVGLGWVIHSPYMAWMGVIVVILGVTVKIAIVQNHIIKLMKLNGTWKNEAVKIQSSEKSASELIEKERKKAETIEDQE